MKVLFLFLALSSGLAAFSQPTVKVFAFEQDNMPGTKPAGVTDENGNSVRKVAVKRNYFIFLSFNRAYSITPIHVFLKGSPLIVKTTAVKKTPIEFTNNNIPNRPEKVVLVPATKNKVLELQLHDSQAPIAKTTTVQKLTDKNDVVVAYLWKNKRYYLTLKEIKKLGPVFNE
jgi:hypothetical protein